MLDIHFSVEDLARVKVARTPDPMWETVLSLHVLGQPRANVLLEGWRRHTLGRLTQPMLRLREFVSSFDYWPDFLTPTNGGVSPERAVTQILATSPDHVRSELLGARGTGAWVTALADDNGSALCQLGEVMLSYFRIGLAPYWLQIQAAADGARARLTRTLIDDSIERMLVDLWPGTNWQPPVLQVPYSGSKDLILAGRDLILLPSFFSSPSPVIRQDPALPPVLVFPIHDAGRGDALSPSAPHSRAATGDKLTALLGRTRAVVLETVGTPCTTSELARRVGISLASASQHATILREAGLLATTRHRNAVIHTTTALGDALMNHHRGLVTRSAHREHMPAAPVGR